MMIKKHVHLLKSIQFYRIRKATYEQSRQENRESLMDLRRGKLFC